MPKRAPTVTLSEKEREELTKITKGHRSEQREVQRAHIVLDAAQGHSNAQIARELKVNVDTVRLWRDRWIGFHGMNLATLSVEERLEDVPRPGKPPKITEEQRCQIAALACEAPSESECPISQWTGREIADEIKERKIVEQISPAPWQHGYLGTVQMRAILLDNIRSVRAQKCQVRLKHALVKRYRATDALNETPPFLWCAKS